MSIPQSNSTHTTEIPTEVEHTAEGQEYVHYFCGIDCYRAWHEKHEREHPGEKQPMG